MNSGSNLAEQWFTRCETSDGLYTQLAATFEMGTKDRKIYLMKAIKLGNVDEIDVETGVSRGGEGD